MKAETIYSVNGIALKGYDPVAFFIEKKAMKGKKEYFYEWNNVKWLFYDSINLEVFKLFPESFSPQYGGFCSYTITKNGIASVDFNFWEIYENKIYFFHSDKMKNLWKKKAKYYLKISEKIWKNVEKKYSPFFEKDGNHISLSTYFN